MLLAAKKTRKKRPAESYVAEVEGCDNGVPFRVKYKRMGYARKVAMGGGLLTDLRTRQTYRWKNEEWVECDPVGKALNEPAKGTI